MQRDTADTSYTASCSATTYTPSNGGNSFHIDCTPSATGQTDGGGNAHGSVAYSCDVAPVVINFNKSTTTDSSGADNILTGQQVEATLEVDGGNYTIDPNAYAWSTAASSAFKDYDETAATDQYQALGDSDSHHTAFYFFTAKNEDADVSCTAEVDCPDGTPLTVDATRKLKSLKPDATLTLSDLAFHDYSYINPSCYPCVGFCSLIRHGRFLVEIGCLHLSSGACHARNDYNDLLLL